MAIIKKYSPYQNLSSFQTFLMDTNPNSDYFRITEFKDTFTGGKNGFLIEGSEFLKETTEVKVEILDVEGNPVYFEPGDGNPEYYEGLSKLVSVHVYDDTPIGIGKITILGELKNYINENGASVPVPDEWKGIYNVRWEKSFKINKNLNNEDVVRFYKRPIVNITEIVKPIFNKTIPTKTISGSVSGIPQQPTEGSDLSTWSAGTLYKLVKSSGSWDVDIDENPITVSVDGNTYTPNIIEVLNEREVLVDVPYTSNNIVQSFTSQSFTASYQDIENEVVGDSSLTGSFAKIDMYQLKTFVGDVARVKVFRKSRNEVGDFQLVQESKLESSELLRDVYTTSSVEIPYGQFNSSSLTNYWETSSNDHSTSVNSAVLNQAVKVDYDNGNGGVQTLSTQESFTLSKDVEYTLSFRTLLSGSSDSEKYVKAYFSGSYINSLGNPTSYTQSFMHVSGSDIYKTRQSVSQNILAERDIDAKLVFEFKGDDWYVSNVSLRNAQETSFSPDEFTLIQDIPRKLEAETFDFRFEFYDINNNYIPVDVKSTKEFDGGNDYTIGGTYARLLIFESDRNAFRFESGSIGSPYNQTVQFQITKTNLTGSTLFESRAFDTDGNYLDPSDYSQYPGLLTNVTPSSALLTLSNFTGSYSGGGTRPYVGSIVYTASCEDLVEYETTFRVEDGDNAPQLLVTSNANQFIYEPTTLSPKPSGQSITIRAQRKNLDGLNSTITVTSGSNLPELTTVSDTGGVKTYSISATEFSSSFASNDFDEVTYNFSSDDIFGNPQTDQITLSKVINFDGVSIVLSNESTSFPANSTGEVTGGFVASSGSVQMYIGGTSISHNDGLSTPNRFDITSISGTNVTPTSISPTNSNYSISAFDTNKDSGSLTLSIDYLAGDNSTTQTFQKVVSYTKAKKGVPTVLTKTSPTTQTINSSSAGFETPQTIDVILQEGGDEYTYLDPPLSPNTFRINSLGYTQGSASFSNEVITLFPSSSLGGIITTGIIGSASIDYRDSEGTSYTNKLVRFDLSVSKIGVDGQNGASGSDAKVVSLNSTAYAIKYDGDGNLSPSGQTFTLSGSVQNFISPEFQFLEDGLVIQSWGSDSDVIVPTDAGTLPSGGQTSLYEVRVRENGDSYAGVFDNIDVFGVQSGSDAFTTFLTNEAHVFAADSTGTVTSVISDGAFETRFFRGAQQYTYDGTSPYDINSYRVANVSATGITISQSTVGSQRKFTPTAISANSGSVTLDLVDNNTGQSFEKTYTFSISKKAEPSITFTSTPQAQSVNATSTGTLNDSIVDVVISGFEGNTALSYNQTATLGVGEYKITNVAGVTVADTTPSTSTIDITAFSGNTATGTASISYKDSEGNTGTDTIKFTLSKSKNATPTVSILASPQAQSVASSSSGIGTPSDVTVTVNEGGSNYTYASSGNSTFQVTGVTNGTNNTDGTITPDTPTDSNGTSGVITLSYINSEGTSVTGKTIDFNVGVSVQGADGGNGPGVVFRGEWDSATTYYDTDDYPTRRDAVLHSGTYYATKTNATTNLNKEPGTPTGTAFWESLGTGDYFVAAKISIFDESYVKNTLNVGENTTGNANITIAGGTTSPYISIGQATKGYNQVGAWIGSDGTNGKLSLKSASNSLLWNGSSLTINGSGTFTGTVTATDGYIGTAAAGFDINSSYFRNGTKTSYNGAGTGVYVGTDGIGLGTAFTVSAAGELTATNVTVSGEINASSGNFSGNINSSATITGGIISGGTITAGVLQGATGDFTGSISAASGDIGGWGIATNEIFSPSTGTKVMSLTAGASPSIQLIDSGDAVVDINSSTTLTDLGAGGAVTTTSITSTTSDTITDNGWTIFTSGNDRTSITDALYYNASTYSTVTIGTGDDGTYTISALVSSPSFGSYSVSGGSGGSVYGSITAGVRLGWMICTNNLNPFNFILDFAYTSMSDYKTISSCPSSGTFTFASNTVSKNVYLSQATYYVYPIAYYPYYQINMPYSGYGYNLSYTYNTPSYSGLSASITIEKTELNAGGLQVVSSNSNYVIMQRQPGISNTSTVMLDVGGSIEASGNITANTSDGRLKNINSGIDNPLDKIKKLNGILYDYNDVAKSFNLSSNKQQVGLIAQEVQSVLPEAVTYAPFDSIKKNGIRVGSKSGENYLTVWYDKLVPLLIEGIKELSDKVEKLEEENKRLRDGN